MKNQVWSASPECAQWSNRLLIVSLAGIGCLTLFPFHFDFRSLHSTWASAFLLGEPVKQGEYLDFFLNILLFIPYGFAISCRLRKRGVSRMRGFILAFVAGALTSYTVELLQYYIPERTSTWDDVGTNSLGAVAGFLIFEFCGEALSRKLSKFEEILEGWLSPLRTAVLLLVFFGLCFGVSIRLQERTRLDNWDAECGLFVGNDGSGKNAWQGQVARVQIWNRAIPEGLMRRMASDGQAPEAQSGLLASYDFTMPPPYVDQRSFLPPLARISKKQPPGDGIQAAEIDSTSWLGTQSPVGDLTRKIEETNQFTIRVICAPAVIHDMDGRIVSISQSYYNVNVHLRQGGTDLVLWFRDPLSQTNSALEWHVPGVFEAGRMRDIVATYDGSDATIYLDGKKLPESYRLSPGATLAHRFMFVRTSDLGGYIVVYEAMVFLPAGLLIGLAARKWSGWKTSGRLVIVAGLLLPPVILELMLVWASGREILAGNILLSLLLSVAGIWTVNADRCAQARSVVS